VKVLIVDDSRTGRGYIMKTLLIAGVGPADILQAQNGQEAVDVLSQGGVGMVFLDINMPVMNGVDVVRSIAEKGLLSSMAVIITSSLSDVSKIEALKAFGVSHFVKKPFKPEEINSIYSLLRKQ
jgi:two-component system chemotaxis response regulator CheY